MNKKKVVKLLECNTYDFNIRKTIEELNELSLILMQSLNKPDKNFTEEIIEEIGDVKLRIAWLENNFSLKKIKKRIETKFNQIKKKKKC